MTIHETIEGAKKAVAGLLPQDNFLRYYQAEFSLIDKLLEEIEEKLHADLIRVEILLEKSR